MGNDNRNWDDSLISLGLGALVVVVSGILLFNFFSSSSKELLNDLSNTASDQTEFSSQEPVVEAVEPNISDTASVLPVAQASVAPTATMVAVVAGPSVKVQIAQASPESLPSPSTAPVVEKPVINPVTSTTDGTLRDSYTVVKGDSLWKIATKYYGSGYEWREIAKENNLKSSNLEIGTTLLVPRKGLASSSSTVAVTDDKPTTVASAVQSAIDSVNMANVTTITYTVVKGDSLSIIAEKQCGAQSQWVTIAKENKLVNPRIIHPGNLLVVNCGR